MSRVNRDIKHVLLDLELVTCLNHVTERIGAEAIARFSSEQQTKVRFPPL
jgi:hypothetical protein